ncbi:hypothetical protein [Magnetospirillum sp. 64-120]|uniref:hypothetical protein n=1 Tax=Magnetospirillum sp. 64-120 TaxID=1895778 RepID=UPI00092C17DA|nr:hypothetical protein [Magnetospirillum sp. 64-120]OJX70349.1 MAG: hypothetical protein BGO92_17310 [Magnetospirillum sp. 64-120]
MVFTQVPVCQQWLMEQKVPMLTGMQIRMARAAMRLRVDDVARMAGLPWARLQHLERQDGPLTGDDATLAALRSFYCERGAIFVDGHADVLPSVQVRADWSDKADQS